MSLAAFFEKNRSIVSSLFGLLIIVFVLITTSKWEPPVGGLLFATGCLLVGVASLGRLWCTLYISGYKDRVLVTVGPYSICRNPLYFFSFLGAIGVGLATETLTFPLIIGIGFALYYPPVIRSEESRLRQIHGEQFEIYRGQTPAFLPSLSRLREPESYQVRPKIFRKHILYALWFIWMLGILELVESFHELGTIPTAFGLY